MRISVGGNVPVYTFLTVAELRQWLVTGCPTHTPENILQSFPGTYTITGAQGHAHRTTAKDTNIYYRTYSVRQAHPLGFFYEAWAILEHDENYYPYNICQL